MHPSEAFDREREKAENYNDKCRTTKRKAKPNECRFANATETPTLTVQPGKLAARRVWVWAGAGSGAGYGTPMPRPGGGHPHPLRPYTEAFASNAIPNPKPNEKNNHGNFKKRPTARWRKRRPRSRPSGIGTRTRREPPETPNTEPLSRARGDEPQGE